MKNAGNTQKIAYAASKATSRKWRRTGIYAGTDAISDIGSGNSSGFNHSSINATGVMKTTGSFGLRLVLALLLAMTLLPVLPISSAFATEFSVSSYSQLADAIRNANNGDTITLSQDIDVPNGASFYSNTSAARTITIKGDGHTVRQTGSRSMFSFMYGDITFINIKFDGNSRLASDADESGGSAIYGDRAKITVLDSTFVNCYTDGEYGGGAICMYRSASVLNVNGCLFSGNRATEYDGGAIYVYVGSGMIANSTFVGNYAGHDGGALRTEYGKIAITNCTLYNNEAAGVGGAISDYVNTAAQMAVVKNTIAIGNRASGSSSQPDVHYAWSGGTDGGNNLFGAVYRLSLATSSKAGINNNAGWLDTVLKNNGGPTLTLALLDVQGGTANNPAIDKGAAGSGVPTHDQRGVSRDANPDIGAFEYVAAVVPVVSDVTLSPLSLVAGRGDTRVFTAEVLGEDGPSPEVVWSVSGAESAGTSIAQSGTTSDGKQEGSLSIGADETAASLTVRATSVEDPQKYAEATITVVSEFYVASGAEYNNAMLSALNPLVIHLEADIADVDAPAIPDVREVVIYGNGHTLTQADGGVSARLEGAGSGGSGGNSLSASNLTIIGGSPTEYKNGGGAIYLASGEVILNNVTISGCSVKFDGTPANNRLKFGGGAVSVALNAMPNSMASNGSITAVNCAFVGNTAELAMDNYGGGALCADQVFLTNCTMYGNSTENSIGGAVYSRIGGSMTNCTVVNNYAGVAGGGIAGRTQEVNGNYTRVQLLNCIVAGNRIAAGTGSGVNADQVYDQGGNIFGYVHSAIDADYRDNIFSASGLRVPAEGSLYNVAESADELELWLASGAPAANGGATPTIALVDLHESIAIDKGLAVGVAGSGIAVLSAPATDQRGEQRDALPDIGAFEYTGARATYKGDLQQLIDEAAALVEDRYTVPSWDALSDALATAQAVMDDDEATQGDVDAAITGIEAAIAGLVPRADSTDLSYLQLVYDFVTAKAGAQSIYSAGSWAAYSQALAVAEGILAQPPSYGAAEVRAAAENLLAKFQALAYVVNKDNLRDAIAAAEAVLENPRLIPIYRAALEEELARALAVRDNTVATQDEVNAAAIALMDLIAYETEAGDKTALQLLAELAAGLEADVWTPNSLAPVTAALATANAVLVDENAVQREIDDAYSALRTALDNLVHRADFSGLVAVIAQADAIMLNSSDYVPSSIAGLPTAVAKAQAVLDNANATQAQVDAARAALFTEVSKARKVADFRQLLAAMQSARALDFSLYTDSSVLPLLAALSYADNLLTLSVEDVTQEMVDAAEADILSAVDGLVLKDTVASGGGESGSGGTGGSGGSGGSGGTGGTGGSGSGSGSGGSGSGSTGSGSGGSGSGSSSGSGGSGSGDGSGSGGSGGNATNSGNHSGAATGNVGAASATNNTTADAITGGANQNDSAAATSNSAAQIADNEVPLAGKDVGAATDAGKKALDNFAADFGLWLPMSLTILALAALLFALIFFKRRKKQEEQ